MNANEEAAPATAPILSTSRRAQRSATARARSFLTGIFLGLLTLALPALAQAPPGGQSQEGPCTDCHSDVDTAASATTVHGVAGIGCTDCHTGAAKPHEEAGPGAVNCADCHQDAV